MKITLRAKLLSLCLGVSLLATGCGGNDDEAAPAAAMLDPCAAVPAPAPASGALAPVSATGAYLCAAGIGVSDLEASVTFYKALGMTERTRLTRSDRREVVLDSADARASRLVLYTYTDGSARNYRQNPGKLVFYVKNASTFAAAFTAAGGTVTSPPSPLGATGITVGFGRDRDLNLVEITSLPAANPSAAQTHSYIAAFGLGASNLAAARDFYVNTLDMKVSQFLQVTKPTSTGGTTPWYDEYILVSNAGRGSAVVLMNYTDGLPKNYNGNPVKLTLRVNDPAAYAQRITAAGVAGASVTRAPAPEAELGGTAVGYATDANGTLLEILNSPL
ncbi:MAG TPA: VOC family protein [Rhizobacter sp.]|nr:VOC family protein [Rhizobacter sp.]